MKKAFKVLGYLVLGIIVLLAAALTYVKLALPNVGDAPELTVQPTTAKIARGEYLANHVTVCMDCHSKRDWTKFSGPVTPGTLGMGGDRFDETVGMPGVFYAKNVTPAGISRYSDGELFRLITTGVTKEGRAMFTLMPYPYYGKMDAEDVEAIIAYLRSIPAIKNDVPDSKPSFPMNFIINTIPQKATLAKRPDTTDILAYGGYLTNAAGCVECHTPIEQGRIIAEKSFGGGRSFLFPDGSELRSSNISPHKTGIGSWTEAMFVQRFKTYADSNYTPPAVKPGEFNSIMPWTMYAGMKESDLKAIYTYLKTVQPQENIVEKFVPKAGK